MATRCNILVLAVTDRTWLVDLFEPFGSGVPKTEAIAASLA